MIPGYAGTKPSCLTPVHVLPANPHSITWLRLPKNSLLGKNVSFTGHHYFFVDLSGLFSHTPSRGHEANAAAVILLMGRRGQ